MLTFVVRLNAPTEGVSVSIDKKPIPHVSGEQAQALARAAGRAAPPQNKTHSAVLSTPAYHLLCGLVQASADVDPDAIMAHPDVWAELRAVFPLRDFPYGAAEDAPVSYHAGDAGD